MRSIRKLEIRQRRVPLAAESTEPYGAAIHTPSDVANIARHLLRDEGHEVFIVLVLDIRNRVLGYNEVGRGGVDTCAVDASAAFRAALLMGGSGVIFAHNHPSGDETPSAEDTALTARLVKIGALIGVPVLDHLVVGDGTHSFRESMSNLFKERAYA